MAPEQWGRRGSIILLSFVVSPALSVFLPAKKKQAAVDVSNKEAKETRERRGTVAEERNSISEVLFSSGVESLSLTRLSM